MINALPFFFGPLGSPTQGTGQAGGNGLDQSQAPGNAAGNPFANILRAQSATSSLLNGRPPTVLSADQRRLSDLEAVPSNPDLSSQILDYPDMPAGFLRESASDSVEAPQSADVHHHSYLVTLLESDGQRLTERGAFVPTFSIPYDLFGVYREIEGREAKSVHDQNGLTSGEFSHDEQLSQAVLSPHILFAGGPGGDEAQAKTTINKPALPVSTGYSTLQPLSVEGGLAEKSPTHLVTISDRQQILQDAMKGHSSLFGSFDGGGATESGVEAGKNIGKPLDGVSRSIQDADMLPPRIPPTSAAAQQGPFRPLGNQAFQTPLPFEETPTSLAGVAQSNQTRLPYVNGVTSLLSEAVGHGKESFIAIPSDLLGESGFSLTGDRPKDVFESTGKIVGVDPDGGQGVNHGMGGSSHSQSGFQQSSSSLLAGSGIRMAEERVPDLPAPALQRLQMDVQLSETNRIQIDVGIQQRQVYAGLLMDQATLKNLAVQFIPQLEDQLAQVDMDLQEFSVEVRDHHREQQHDTSLHHSGMLSMQQGSTASHRAPETVPTPGKRVEEQGLHLVA
jgi:hypothetical protein